MKVTSVELIRGKIAAMRATEPKYAYHFLNDAQNPSTEWDCVEDMIDSCDVFDAEPMTSCSERQPKESGLYLTYQKSLRRFQLMRYFPTPRGMGWGDEIYGKHVTHWMPMPAEPKDEQE